jgi:HK97 family phage major capsid protein
LTTVSGVAEAATLPSAATDLDALDIVFQKFATYELLSSENIEDANSDALSILGERMLKDLAVRVDSGLIQGNGASDVVGIFNQSGVSTTSVAGVATIAKAQEAEFQLLNNDGKPSAWIMAPRSWIGTAGFRRIVTGVASSIQPVLQMDPSQNVNTLSGYPVYLSSSISTTTGATSVGSTAALVDASQLVIVTRRAPRLEVSRDVQFATDSVAIRATTRMGFAVLDAAGGVSLLTDIRTA